MAVDKATFQKTIVACTKNAERLLEEAEWAYRASTGLALAMLSQEECAKAFLLALVRDGILPWSSEVRRSLSIHECKHLVTLIMEWLLEVNEARRNESIASAMSAQHVQNLPADVAIAMNIYRHELIERVGKRHPERRADWRGRARKLADGQRDRRKQAALYVRIGDDGSLSGEPTDSQKSLDEELVRTRALLQFARDTDRNVIFADREYEMFSGIFATMFSDHGPAGVAIAPEERHDSGIAGIVAIKRTVACANVVDAAPADSASTSLGVQPTDLHLDRDHSDES